MERVAPSSQLSQHEQEDHLGLPINRLIQTKHTSNTSQNFPSLETYLYTNAFNILCLLTYTLSLSLVFLWGAHDQFITTNPPTNKWLISTARAFGYSLNLNTALVIVLASRLFFTLLRNTPLNIVLPLDNSFPTFHIIVAYVIILSVIPHTLFHIIWIVLANAWAPGLWNINMCVATGFALASVLFILFLSALPSIRKNHFTFFYSLHNIAAPLFYVLLLFHGVYKGVPYTYKWLLVPLLLYSLDRIARNLNVSTSNLIVTGRNSILKHDDIVMMRVPKQFNFRAGQYAEIKVPAISRYEWHPFTIASAPFEESMCFYIKCIGDWTAQLRACFEERLTGNNPIPMQVFIRGPFGAPAQHVRGYQRVVLISGGVGATPFSSICKELFHHINTHTTLTFQTDRRTPEPPALLTAETDLRSSLSDLYERNVDHFANEEAFMGGTPMVSVQDLFEEDHQRIEFTSPISDESDQPFSQGDYLDRLGLSFDMGRKLNAAAATPISVKREARYTLFERSFPNTEVEDDALTGSDSARVRFFSSKAPRLLLFFHSVILNMFLCVAILLRISFVACASIFRSTMFSASQISSPSPRELAFASLDIGLGVLMIGILLSSVVTELCVYRMSFFKTKSGVANILLLLPLSFLSILYSVRIVLGPGFMFYLPSWAHFLIILPLLIATLCHRLYRVIGAKVALADFASEPNLEKLRAVDFIWTVPFEKDDRWLREELGPVANGQELRLHRFLTRQEKQVSEEGEKRRGMTTTYGRPDWDSVFTKLAERTPSGGKVGVFFCGPKGMSKAIVASIRKVQILSNLRGTYLGTSSDRTLKTELGIERDDIRRLRARGCNIRFVFREEKFS